MPAHLVLQSGGCDVNKMTYNNIENQHLLIEIGLAVDAQELLQTLRQTRTDIDRQTRTHREALLRYDVNILIFKRLNNKMLPLLSSQKTNLDIKRQGFAKHWFKSKDWPLRFLWNERRLGVLR